MIRMAGESYDIRCDEGAREVIFNGTLRLSGMEEYQPILDLMRRCLCDGGAHAVLNVKGLEFLNSSGITMFSRFIIDARQQPDLQVKIVCSELIPWHARSLKNLQRLMPALEIEMG